MYDAHHDTRSQPAHTWQKVLNASWPPQDVSRLGDVEVGREVACEVRLEFERDGEVWLPGTATRWTRTHAYIRVSDSRVMNWAVWVRGGDVRRV